MKLRSISVVAVEAASVKKATVLALSYWPEMSGRCNATPTVSAAAPSPSVRLNRGPRRASSGFATLVFRIRAHLHLHRFGWRRR